ncbi:hypothetical protein BACERE00193_04698 [Bacillus paranthracis]|nr:hypothetical protein B4116_0003 [Bacillus cereus]SMD71780.1 hypothetical protein BACERE00176_00214 [Bacillus paranthracis]KZD82563.1 hypothetical protein B4155_2424 [Bacillus cereus]KZD82644.1 hypothetical protein B4120_1531 [Bacillus cereus]SMD64634.1 hypothetical protein BACERE00175_00449 [Bacillus cereus]
MTWKVTVKELFVLTVPILTPLFGFAPGMVLPFTAKLFSIKVVPAGMRSEKFTFVAFVLPLFCIKTV